MRPRILIAARSVLAMNVYRLLLSPWEPDIIMASRFAEARPWFYRAGRLDLAVFHSDIFVPSLERFENGLKGEGLFAATKKIFVCGSSPRERRWQKALSKVPASYVIERPFSTDEFKGFIKKVLR